MKGSSLTGKRRLLIQFPGMADSSLPDLFLPKALEKAHGEPHRGLCPSVPHHTCYAVRSACCPNKLEVFIRRLTTCESSSQGEDE